MWVVGRCGAQRGEMGQRSRGSEMWRAALTVYEDAEALGRELRGDVLPDERGHGEAVDEDDLCARV